MITSYTKEDVLKIREIKDKFATDRGYSNYVEYVLDMSSNETNLKQLHLNEECILRLIMNEFLNIRSSYTVFEEKCKKWFFEKYRTYPKIQKVENGYVFFNAETTGTPLELIDNF